MMADEHLTSKRDIMPVAIRKPMGNCHLSAAYRELAIAILLSRLLPIPTAIRAGLDMRASLHMRPEAHRYWQFNMQLLPALAAMPGTIGTMAHLTVPVLPIRVALVLRKIFNWLGLMTTNAGFHGQPSCRLLLGGGARQLAKRSNVSFRERPES